MASNATIFKATLQIADLDRNYYADHALTLARHPSETDERMMMRLLAFMRHAHPDLAFGRGLSTEEEPDLWRHDLTGGVELWIEVGQPDDKRLRRVCHRAREVIVYNYGGRGADPWWDQNRAALARLDNLAVFNLPFEASGALARLARRSMKLQFTVQDGQILLADGEQAVTIELVTRKQISTHPR
jgi:uncharacterized protein YaeQ